MFGAGASAGGGGDSGDADVDALTRAVSIVSLGSRAPLPRTVYLIHSATMQAHAPPCYEDVFELPCRTVAIETVLKGMPYNTHIVKTTKRLHVSGARGGAKHGEVGAPPVQPVDSGALIDSGLEGGFKSSPLGSGVPQVQDFDPATLTTEPIELLLEGPGSIERLFPAPPYRALEIA